MMNTVYKIKVSGLVQGIGFRPFVAELAEKLELAGQVKNLGGIVEILIAGDKEAVDTFVQRLGCVGEELRGCRVDELIVEDISHYGQIDREAPSLRKGEFRIVESGNGREIRRFLPVDLPTCDRCVEEMHDSSNRRYRYPFISCTSCGPRFSIQKRVPYDRETITMDSFPMCEDCADEYTEKGNIRRHAQTIACKNCGPKLKYIARTDTQDYLQTDEQQAISEAVQALLQGKIGAIKDIGGYHFAFLPTDSQAASRLREFKNRDKKPFAVMFLNLDEVREYCEVSRKEAELLTSAARPIVLLKKKKDFVSEICGESDRIGALLPCNPLQILLLEETGPLVMTSGNRGGEPIIISEEEMLTHLGNGIDFLLTHDREILTPLDDSIYQVTELDDPIHNKEQSASEDIPGEVSSVVQLIRRARGLAPEPIRLHRKFKKDTFAAGGDLKAVFALGREELVYLSQYFGDLEDVRCAESREAGLKHITELLEIQPEVAIGDLHPAYFSSKNTGKKVQHHHAHVASVIAEHGLYGKVLGVACDGTGFGIDGTIWGSEFLLCENEKMIRVGHFSSVKLVGGDTSAKQADMTLYSYMLEARERGLLVEDFFLEHEKVNPLDMRMVEKTEECQQKNNRYQLQEMAWKQNINTVYSSSMGRLFDAVSALLDICNFNSYEGECAIKLEQAAHKGKAELEKLGLELQRELKSKIQVRCANAGGIYQADSVGVLVDLYHLKVCYSKEILAYIFHHVVANAIVEISESICELYGINQVALSGGTFINRILLSEVINGLVKRGKHVYINEKVPCGDGGIALGQIYLATFE